MKMPSKAFTPFHLAFKMLQTFHLQTGTALGLPCAVLQWHPFSA